MSFLFFFLSIYIFSSVHGVEVTPNSDCASFCLPSPNLNPSQDLSSSTQTGDLVCNDWELDGSNSTRKGRLFHDCIQCQSNSTAVDKSTKENDVYWFLFNIKFTLDWCIFSYPDNNSTTQSRACSHTCAGPQSAMKLAMTDQLLKTNASLQYQYCEDGDGAFAENVDDCVECLQDIQQSMALVNYLRALNAACKQKPKAGNGKPVKLAFDIYDLVSASASASPSVSSSTSSSTSAPSSSPTTPATHAPASTPSSSLPANTTQTPSPPTTNTHTLRLALGISLGLILPLLLLSAFLIFFLRRRRAHRSQPPKPTLEMQHSEPNHYPPSYRNGPIPEMQAPVSNDVVHEVDGDNPPRRAGEG